MNTLIPYVPNYQYPIMQSAPVPPPMPEAQPIYQPIPVQTPIVPCNPNTVTQRLINLSTQIGYDLIQQNGQRRLGPPPNGAYPPPSKGSEIFVGKLPRDMFEDELYPIFSAVGPVYEIRLMMNFSGYNRGFAFVTYCYQSDAWRAVNQLNDFEVRPGCRIGVSKSVDNCRLYIGGIPPEKNKEDAWNELSKYLQGITGIIMYPQHLNRNLNRGFMFVEFCTHRAAAMAKRKMSPGTVQLWNKTVNVDWADPEPDIDPNVLSTVTKLFIRNISPNVNDRHFRRILQTFLPTYTIQRIYIAEDYGFIHFSNRIHAQLALDRINGMCLDGYSLEAQWARPRSYVQTTINTQMNFCRSLPPKFRKNTNSTATNSVSSVCSA